tara:strand:- start:154 stop:318 length:165 start_codon:yes stop_codon:yes gene_type:complete
MANYDYAKHCGCGDRRCNNGWYYWNGTEYPCNYQSERRRKERQEEKQKEEVSDV